MSFLQALVDFIPYSECADYALRNVSYTRDTYKHAQTRLEKQRSLKKHNRAIQKAVDYFSHAFVFLHNEHFYTIQRAFVEYKTWATDPENPQHEKMVHTYIDQKDLLQLLYETEEDAMHTTWIIPHKVLQVVIDIDEYSEIVARVDVSHIQEIP